MGNGSRHVLHLLGTSIPEGQEEERQWKGPHRQDVWSHAPQRGLLYQTFQMNMAGMGTKMMKSLMKKKNVASVEQNDRNGRGTGSTDLRVRDVDGSHGIQERGNDRLFRT